MIEFDKKRIGMRPFSPPEVTDEILEQSDHYVSSVAILTGIHEASGIHGSSQTQAMIISTQHLLPSTLPTPTAALDAPPTVPTTGMSTPSASETQPERGDEAAKALAARKY